MFLIIGEFRHIILHKCGTPRCKTNYVDIICGMIEAISHIFFIWKK